MIKITVWHEVFPENEEKEVLKTYTNGIGNALSDIFRGAGFEVRNAYLDEKDNGLSEEILRDTDVLVWWGHRRHDKVDFAAAGRVVRHVNMGMGIIFLHSAHLARPFTMLTGTSCTLKWRDAGEKERLWVTSPSHEIAKGIPSEFVLDREEMYGEFFDVPEPDETVFIGWFEGGNVFRSGLTYKRGLGKVFYFQPGHETFPSFHNEYVKSILINSTNWAKPAKRIDLIDCEHSNLPLEKIK